MKYDIVLFNADRGEHKYLCRILGLNDASILFVKDDAKFSDEDELRKKLTGILLASEIDTALRILRSHHLQEARFHHVEIASHQLETIGWRTPKTM